MLFHTLQPHTHGNQWVLAQEVLVWVESGLVGLVLVGLVWVVWAVLVLVVWVGLVLVVWVVLVGLVSGLVDSTWGHMLCHPSHRCNSGTHFRRSCIQRHSAFQTLQRRIHGTLKARALEVWELGGLEVWELGGLEAWGLVGLASAPSNLQPLLTCRRCIGCVLAGTRQCHGRLPQPAPIPSC